MEFLILGPLEVRGDQGRGVPLGPLKQRAVLAILLLHANEVVSSERLIEELWNGAPPRSARTALQVQISRLRQQLGADAIWTKAPGYVLTVDPERIDARRFDRLLAEARELGPEGRAAKLREALALWRGPPLDDLTFEPFAAGEIARLEDLRVAALEDRIDADLELGRHAELVGELEAAIIEHPLRERLRGQLIVALYHAGRQAEALEAYRKTRRVLAEELGLEPSPPLRELERSILRQDLPAVFPEAEEGGDRRAPRMRSRLVLVTAALVAVLVLAAVVLATSDHEPSPALILAPNSVGVIDPHSNELIAQVAVGRRPVRIAVGADAVWVANEEDGTVSRIDPATRTVSRNIRARTAQGGIAVFGDTVWVSGKTGRRNNPDFGIVLSRIDPQVNAVTEIVRFHGTGQWRYEQPVRVAAGARNTWVTAGWQLLRVDAGRGRVVETIDEFTTLSDVAVGAQAVWAVELGQGDGPRDVIHMNPTTHGISARIPVAPEPAGIAVGEGAVWVAIDSGTVARIDPEQDIVTATIQLGGAPSGIAIGEGAIWVANSGAANVARIDPTTNEVVATIPLGRRPDAIAVGEGRVWVTAY